MNLDTTPSIRELANQFADQILERYDEHDDAFVRTVMIVVEVDRGDDTELLSVSTEDRGWCQVALLTEARIALEDMLEAAQRDSE